MDVIGKVGVRIFLQERLQKLVEDELPKSQCRFRKGRSRADMIFTVHQLVQKPCEHKCTAFFTFVDLKKTHNSVPREAMWMALAKTGIPEEIVVPIKSFHLDMKVRIRMDGAMLEKIMVKNGLRQGCCMAPVLFNFYTCLAVERWLVRVRDNKGVGITI